MDFRIKKKSALLYSIVLYFIIIALNYFFNAVKLGWTLTYCLDDAYIHMAMAKNAALHSVWGITQYNFSSSTSSPLWTLILTLCFKFFGIHTIIPFILNIIAGLFIIITAYNILSRYYDNGITLFVILSCMILLVPLPVLAFTGMEHLLQILLISLFVQKFISVFTEDNKKSYYLLLLLSSLICVVRYENYFMIIGASIVFLYEKKIYKAFMLLASGWVLISIYGIWSLLQGWFFVPNTILIKGHIPPLSVSAIILFIQEIFKKVANDGLVYAFIILLISFVLIDLCKRTQKPSAIIKLNYMILITYGIHIIFALVTPFFRYEAYLIFLGLIAAAISFTQYTEYIKTLFSGFSKQKFALVISLLLVLLMPFILRSIGGLISVTPASKNIYEQQCQMASFVNKYYDHSTLALNDIGAISFFTNAHVIDIIGLADLDVAKLVKTRKYNPNEIEALTKKKNFEVAIIYDKWFDNSKVGGIPKSWVKCGSWKVDFNRVLGDDKVTFYAADSSIAKQLVNNLKEFNKNNLPKDIASSVD